MAVFVNRDEELSRVNRYVTTLLDESRLLRTPIIEFYGISGIGKTALLRKIEQDFKVRVHCVVGNARDMDRQSLVEAISEAVKKNARVAVILDALDSASKQQLQDIESVLGQFIDSGRLFVILSSRDKYQFNGTLSIARKITLCQLQPLTQQYCEVYMSQSYSTIDLDNRKKIFEWTRGYPLAMSVMADAIYNKQVDLQSEQDQKQVLSIIIDKVVNQNLFARISSDPDKLARFRKLFSILSVPRRSNLILIKNLVDRFAPDYRLGSSLAYTSIPQSINEVMPAFDWNQKRAGYCIDSSMRTLFLLQIKIEQPEFYVKIHKFLAEKNKEFAGQVSGLDHIRYLREFFYHLAHCEAETSVKEYLGKYIEALLPAKVDNISTEVFDNFLQFYEEFQQDEELKEILALENTKFAMSLLRKLFIDVYKHLPMIKQSDRLLKFFACTASGTRKEKDVSIFEDVIQKIMYEESVEVRTMFSNILSQDQNFRVLLGEECERILSLFTDSSLGEDR